MTGIGVYEDHLGVKRVKHVDTTAGRIKTNCVVNATGVWAPYIGAMAGVSVPLVAMHHSYIVTEKIEGTCEIHVCRMMLYISALT